ncbi:serpin family protein [Dactylosporangium salmoneum]|uniref:Serpin domain-containing protein n=1 Tax=Dactylosporangium salmoneum TaxID=53361 RepID=A0ABP5SZW4_9ACTN
MSVERANRLTAAWAATLPGDGATVLSGAGVYPLLALLGGAADGPAADELRAVAPTPLDLPASVRAAVGLWARAGVPLTPAWRALVAGLLTADRGPLDRWASESTGGLIPAMPIQIEDDTRLVLAGALAIDTAWAVPFLDGPMPVERGPWEGRRLSGLSRRADTPAGLATADTAAGPLTLATVAGADDLDVVLVIGEEGRGPGALLPAAVAAFRAPGELRTDGPGVMVQESVMPGFRLELPRFTVRADHDLLAHAEVFGLRTAADNSRGHFPGIADEPLAVSAAAQAAVATFTAEGFRAAAVTAFGIAAGAGFFTKSRMVQVRFDRPFGFLAVHRPSGLVLFAGWVAEPEPWDAQPEPWDA